MTRIALLIALVLVTNVARAEPLRVCATVPSLGSLVREVGGDQVEVTVFTKGTDDPHFAEARPSFIKALSKADLLVLVGMDLEVGWLPPLLQNARNGRVLPGAKGYLDASTPIAPLEVPSGAVDRSMGDVHLYGNPHYLLDPQNGLAVARKIAERLSELAPASASAFAARLADFEVRANASLERWSTLARPLAGARAVSDHRLWTYFARRFQIEMVGTLEPKPGVPPTTRHLQELIERMRAQDVRLLLSAAYYDPRHAQFVADQTGARIASMAQEVGAQPGTDDYLSMVDYNVRQLVGSRGGS
jgi:ABC-type Zn uptake system ZnuABC Zn-binding protein ZnuA